MKKLEHGTPNNIDQLNHYHHILWSLQYFPSTTGITRDAASVLALGFLDLLPLPGGSLFFGGGVRCSWTMQTLWISQGTKRISIATYRKDDRSTHTHTCIHICRYIYSIYYIDILQCIYNLRAYNTHISGDFKRFCCQTLWPMPCVFSQP